MKEPQRIARNTERLDECFPTFAERLKRVIARLDKSGIRPRIQDAWRSPQDQLAAFNSGHSKLKFGFHNVTGAGGQKEALAVDLLDDDAPLEPPTSYILQLAAAASAEGLTTGVLWGLLKKLRDGAEAALANKDFKAKVKVGWDHCHAEPVGLRPSDAKAGQRPT